MRAHYRQMADGELVNQFRAQADKMILSELYQRHSKWVYYKALALLKAEQAAKDLSHDVFLKAFLRISTLKKPERFRGWLSTITYNMSMDALNLKKEFKRDQVSIDERYDLSDETDEEEKEDKILLEMNLVELERLMQQLADGDRVILLMRYQDEMSILEIKELLNIGESAVKMRIKRAKEKLARLFEESKK